MKNLDVLMLAMLVLDPEEFDACFLSAFHKLSSEEQVLIEDAGLEVMRRARLDRSEEALETVAKLGMHLQVTPRAVAVNRASR